MLYQLIYTKQKCNDMLLLYPKHAGDSAYKHDSQCQPCIWTIIMS